MNVNRNCISKDASAGSHAHRLSILGLIVALGIVFGDIGTSPLYVMKAIVGANPGYDADYIIGAVSCIFWTLTLQTTVKYVIIALRADNHGEGGILALYALLRGLKHKWLYIVAAVGASALIADGVITPAVTVTSAIEGLTELDPSISALPIACAIICVIFFMQQMGTGKIGRFFGPYMLVWFLTLGVAGIVNALVCPAIFKAVNPYYAVKLLISFPGWFLILGAVFLCTTGAEALYSDLGHCGRRNITISWIFVKISLFLNYAGQGAWLISRGAGNIQGVNPFYGIMPEWFKIPAIVLATGAAVIASQALISGSFTIFSEAINLNFWPRLRIKYPSTLKGQLYVPAVNMLLFVGCMLTLFIFRTSSHMEAAYGLAITLTMLMTTVLLAFYLHHKGCGAVVVTLFSTVFFSIEGVFFTSNLFKFVHGGWYSITFALIVLIVMLGWYISTKIRDRYFIYERVDAYLPVIKAIKEDDSIPYFAANAVFLSHSPNAHDVEAKLIYSIINKSPKRAQHYWLLRIEQTDEPDTLTYTVDELIPGTLFSIGLRIGFRVHPQLSRYFRQIVEDMVHAGRIDLTSPYSSLREFGIAGNFRFVIIHRVFSTDSNCPKSYRLAMSFYDVLRHLGISDENAFGLDTSVVSVENVPLIINTSTPRRIHRVQE